LPKSQRAERYQVAVELSRGVLGVQSVGHSPSRAVLLRRIEPEPPWNAKLLDELTESAKRAVPIHHPSLLAVVDPVRSTDGLLIATEYVQGVPLPALLARARERRRPIPPTIAQRIALDLARALAAAQEVQKAHGDERLLAWIHPECVFISSGDDALIADVGMISLERVPEHPSVAAYRAPELASGAPVGSSAVFSLGILLWELLAGRDALGQTSAGATVASVQQRAAAGAVPRLDLVTKNLPSLLVEIVMQSVHRVPGSRFPNVKAFADALKTGTKVRGGELVGFMTELAGDVLDRQRNALIHTSIAPASWRPTAHGIDVEMPAIPKAPRLIGLAAFGDRTEQPIIELSVESGQAIDAFLTEVKTDPGAAPAPAPAPVMKPDSPAPVALGAAREPHGTMPVLLVHKALDAPAPAREREIDTRALYDEEPAFRPRRRWALLVFVLLVLGAAGTLIVLAVQKQMQAAGEDGEAPLSAQRTSAAEAAAESAAPAPSASLGASARAPRFAPGRPARPHDTSAEAGTASAPSSAPAGPSAPEPEIENPYRTPKPPPAPSATSRSLGF
jgi:Protein kinase domain